MEFSRTNGCNAVRLEIPARIEHRDMVLRTVSAACELLTPDARSRSPLYPELTTQIVSAVGEAYNNIVLHGFAGREPGRIQIRVENCDEWIRVMIMDTGMSFHPSQAAPPDLEAFPESGLGIFIMRSFVDEVTYVAGAAGTPNVLTLFKRLDEALGAGPERESAGGVSRKQMTSDP